MSNLNSIKFNGYDKVKLLKWKIKKGTILFDGIILFTYNEHGIEKKFKFEDYGTVVNVLISENEFINPGQVIIEYEKCAHTTVMKDLCAECGMDLRKSDNYDNNASVSMIHSVPELKVSYEQAQQLGKADEEKLLKSRKLVLLVDLDQTLIHTTNRLDTPINQINNKDVVTFRLYPNSPFYYTKLRPNTNEFLESISKYYELHICTFGARMYAHKIAEILDPGKKLFSHRILSRDECFDPQLKTGNLKALFPCGDSMVCIIDDREDVWNYQPNLIAVKPYNYFSNTGDINSPNKQKDDLLAKAAKVLSNKNKKDGLKEGEDEDENKEEDNNEDESKQQKEEIKKEDNIKEEDKEDMKTDNNVEKKDNISKEDDNVKKVEDIKIEDEDKNLIKNETKDKKDESTPSSSKTIIDDDNDDYLLYLPEILKRIHRKFYKEYDEIMKYAAEGEHIKIPDLKYLIPSIRKEVLKGCNIVFSGLIPTKLPIEQSKLWDVAKQLGANVTTDIIKDGSPIERTTHLIASNSNTHKVQEALKIKRIHVVNPIWLYTCSERWERVDERLFELDKQDDFRNPDNLKIKLSVDQKMFLNYDLVKLSTISKNSKRDAALKIVFKNQEEQQKQGKQTENLNNQFPTYDPITGKLIRRVNTDQQSDKPSTSKQQLTIDLNKEDDELLKNEDDSILTPHSMIEFNPLSAFSTNDFKMMNDEVDDACSEEDEDSMDQRMFEENDDENESDEENIDYGDEPVLKKRKKEIECLSESSDTSLSFGDSNSNAELAQKLEDFLN